MHWAKWIVLVVLVLSPGWMVLDGGRALIVGNYVTPRHGPHAGQLGPWSKLVSAVGIEPRSSTMKWIFVIYGLTTITIGISFLLGKAWAWMGLLIMAALGLWYIPFGALLHIFMIVVLLLPGVRPSA